MKLRRLDPIEDEQLIRESIDWIDQQPLFYRNCNAVWGSEDADDYLRHMKEDPQADFGVFEGEEMVAVITVTLEGKGIYNSHLMVKRGANPETIAMAAMSVIKQLFEHGMVQGWSWLAEKNYGARHILESIGMKLDGVSRFKGQSHGKPIYWKRYSVVRAA